MPRIASIVVHCRDPYRLAPFWSVATGLPMVDEDKAKVDSRSLAPGEAVLLRDPTGRTPEVWIAPVDDTLTPPGRVHLDIACEPGDEETILSAGATVVRRMPKWTVLADPEGNQFCVLSAAH
ncbi:VOC family protein [Actinoplanes subtropicus]|uniref:VOC family protein n=1 Tax=Actinoplanes subtropicus TaxID=543632 RepID=UPI0004C3BC33|nr:VOC family protein [Actinoplanes subtropicus]